jgi:hypothetical protein
MSKSVLVLCGTGSERIDYLDDPPVIYGPFENEEEARAWLWDSHANIVPDVVPGENVCELRFMANRDHSLAYLTAPDMDKETIYAR